MTRISGVTIKAVGVVFVSGIGPKGIELHDDFVEIDYKMDKAKVAILEALFEIEVQLFYPFGTNPCPRIVPLVVEVKMKWCC